ncbi:hypothetical protein J6590_002405 [Homalodisca vitripennis]|nr:hypothetical protein J6590_002405 [Homalodisca vitripennis]
MELLAHTVQSQLFPPRLDGESSAQAQHACAQCGRQYKYVQGLRAHVKYECGKPPSFRCQFCTKAFHLAGNLKKHVMLMHQQSPIPQRAGASIPCPCANHKRQGALRLRRKYRRSRVPMLEMSSEFSHQKGPHHPQPLLF